MAQAAINTLRLPPGEQELGDIHLPVRIIPQDRRNPSIITNNIVVYADDVELDGLVFTSNVDPQKGLSGTALMLRGERNHVQRCTFQDVYDAIVAEKQCCIHHNTIVDFAGDGIRFCGNGSRIAYNTIGLLQQIAGADRAHHDGIQMYAGDPESPMRSAGRYDAKFSLDDVHIAHNHIFDVPDSTLQGITLFDGLSRNMYVGNNVIHLFSNHPLTLRGSIDPALFNNHLNLGDVKTLPARRQLASGGWENVHV